LTGPGDGLARDVIIDLVRPRLEGSAREFLERSVHEIDRGVSTSRFSTLISLASRHARRNPLALSADECERATRLLAGWTPERWSVVDALRVALILARGDLAEQCFAEDLEDCFRCGDEGELCALYRSLALLPAGERFRWRAGEGCRTNLQSVFEAAACDTPYPAQHFDDVAWRQLVIKAVFIDVPLSRVHGVQTRLSPELARMALDLVDERRKACRGVPAQLWQCLGPHGESRAVIALEQELHTADEEGRRAVRLALSRVGMTHGEPLTNKEV
jgi:hypothetical protein